MSNDNSYIQLQHMKLKMVKHEMYNFLADDT